jgi:hypothetical protein
MEVACHMAARKISRSLRAGLLKYMVSAALQVIIALVYRCSFARFS